MRIPRFNSKTAAPVSNMTVNSDNVPVFTDTNGGQWVLRSKYMGEDVPREHSLLPMSDQDYEPEFDPPLPSKNINIQIRPSKTFGGWSPKDLAAAARASASPNTYGEAYSPRTRANERKFFCTASHLENLKSNVLPHVEKQHQEASEVVSQMLRNHLNQKPLDPLSEPTDEDYRIAKDKSKQLKSQMQEVKSKIDNSYVVNQNEAFRTESIVQPGHLVTLRNLTPGSAEPYQDTTYYLLSHPSPEIEAAHPGAQHLDPHSFLARDMMEKPRGTEVVDRELRAVPTLWNEAIRDQAVAQQAYRIRRELSPAEQEDLFLNRGYMQSRNVNAGRIVDIQQPSAKALSANVVPSFNSGS